jgi:hypothetical protein
VLFFILEIAPVELNGKIVKEIHRISTFLERREI